MVDGPLPPAADGEPWTNPYHRWINARTRALWLLAAVAMVLDVALTGVGLSVGLAEGNYLARLFIREFGLISAGVLLKGFALGVGYAAWRLLPHLDDDAARHRYFVPLGLALPSWAAVGVNAVMILSVS